MSHKRKSAGRVTGKVSLRPEKGTQTDISHFSSCLRLQIMPRNTVALGKQSQQDHGEGESRPCDTAEFFLELVNLFCKRISPLLLTSVLELTTGSLAVRRKETILEIELTQVWESEVMDRHLSKGRMSSELCSFHLGAPSFSEHQNGPILGMDVFDVITQTDFNGACAQITFCANVNDLHFVVVK